MRSQLLLNLLLFVLAVGLGAFLFFDEEVSDKPLKLSHISADSITKISIQHNQQEITLSKKDKIWRLLKPIKVEANQFRIKTLLQLLSTSSHSQYDTDKLDLKKYDLENSKTVIGFNNHKIYFGTISPINKLRYVRLNNTVHLTDDFFYPLLSSQIGTLASRQLIPATNKIVKLVLPEQTLTLRKNKLWQSTSKISSDAMIETIHQWTHKQAFAVHDYRQGKPLATIQVFLGDLEKPIIFHLTDDKPWLIISRPDLKLSYHFNLEDYDTLLKPDNYRDKSKTSDTASDTLQVPAEEFLNNIQAQ